MFARIERNIYLEALLSLDSFVSIPAKLTSQRNPEYLLHSAVSYNCLVHTNLNLVERQLTFESKV